MVAAAAVSSGRRPDAPASEAGSEEPEPFLRWRGNVKKPFEIDRSFVLTALTVAGMLLAILALWPLPGGIAPAAAFTGLSLVYLAGGVPAAWRAAVTLWEEHILDIDLLMVVAAVAAAAVGAPLEGAVLLTLFSVST